MKEAEYLRKAYVLADKLEDALLAKPYDPNVHQNVIDRLQALHSTKYQRRRRRPWSAVMFVICLFLLLLYIVWEILFNLKIMDSQ